MNYGIFKFVQINMKHLLYHSAFIPNWRQTLFFKTLTVHDINYVLGFDTTEKIEPYVDYAY